MTAVRRPSASCNSAQLAESSGTSNSGRSKENYDNSVAKMKSDSQNSEMKCEACANKSAVNGQILTEAVRVGPTYLEARLQQKAIEKKNDTDKWRIIRDVLMISLAFMVQFTAFLGTSHLQSSVNAADGLGTRSLMTIYAAQSLSAIFLPVLLIKYV
jgi:hypothetical protein